MENLKGRTYRMLFDVMLSVPDLKLSAGMYYLYSQALKDPVQTASLEVFDRMKLILKQS